MNQKQLKYFLEVYEQKSISKAAKNLYISPQGLSKTISSLERELQTELFIHKANRIITTNEAASLASHARNILNEYDIICNRLFQNQDTRKSLYISCSFDVPQILPIEFIYQFLLKHSEILLQFREHTENSVLTQLDNHSVELAILSGPLDGSLYHISPLLSVPFYLLINREHPLADKTAIRLADLNEQPLAVRDMNTHTSVLQAESFLKKGFSPHIILETTDSHLIINMAENNYAIGMMIQPLADQIRSENILIRPFADVRFSKTIYLVRKKDFILSQEAEIFSNALLSFFPQSL